MSVYDRAAGVDWPDLTAEDLDDPRCSHCRADKPDLAGLSIAETDEWEGEEYGFCGLACLVLFVRSRYMDAPS